MRIIFSFKDLEKYAEKEFVTFFLNLFFAGSSTFLENPNYFER